MSSLKVLLIPGDSDELVSKDQLIKINIGNFNERNYYCVIC